MSVEVLLPVAGRKLTRNDVLSLLADYDAVAGVHVVPGDPLDTLVIELREEVDAETEGKLRAAAAAAVQSAQGSSELDELKARVEALEQAVEPLLASSPKVVR